MNGWGRVRVGEYGATDAGSVAAGLLAQQAAAAAAAAPAPGEALEFAPTTVVGRGPRGLWFVAGGLALALGWYLWRSGR